MSRANSKSGGTKAAASSDSQKNQGHGHRPTVEDVVSDVLTTVAQAYWAPGQTKLQAYNAQIVEDIYARELSTFDIARVAILEFSQYLENYLWKNFDADKASFAHIMSMVLIINEKFRDTSLNVWDTFHSKPDQFDKFLQRAFSLHRDHKLSVKEKTAFVLFMIHCFQSLEDNVVRKYCTRVASLPLWFALSDSAREHQFRVFDNLRPVWKSLSSIDTAANSLDATLLPRLTQDFFQTLEHGSGTAPANGASAAAAGPTAMDVDGDHTASANGVPASSDHAYDRPTTLFTERYLEFITDLIAQLSTRRFVRPYLEHIHFVVRCQLSPLYTAASGKLFRQMLDQVKFYMGFEIDDKTGQPLTDSDMIDAHYLKLTRLQKVAYKYFRDELMPLVLAPVSGIDTRTSLVGHLDSLSNDKLFDLAHRLRLLPDEASDVASAPAFYRDRKFLLEVLLTAHERRLSQKHAINKLPLYPSEDVLWDENLVPSMRYTGEECLALPKLNLQFLTYHDYMLRNFHLFRLESTYEIREDVSKFVARLRPKLANNMKDTIFTGWARYAMPLTTFTVTHVKKPNIGEVKPAMVKADIKVNLLPFNGAIRQEWEEIKQHDVLFLLTVQATPEMGKETLAASVEEKWDTMDYKMLGIRYVRGCEVVDVLDESKKVIGERDKDGRVHSAVGSVRTFRVLMDAAQYELDMAKVAEGGQNPNTTFNLVMRRKPKENNFKAVLKTIRDLMQSRSAIPSWLQDVFLGYGDPSSAQYHRLNTQIATLNFRDTFLDGQHLRDALPEYDVQFLDYKGQPLAANAALPPPPYRVTFPVGVAPDYEALYDFTSAISAPSHAHPAASALIKPVSAHPPGPVDEIKATAADAAGAVKALAAKQSPAKKAKKTTSQPKPVVQVQPYLMDKLGPYASHVPRLNKVRFTPMQLEAIKSGLNPGLTMIVGPPGTGKTDVAVQILSELYHNFPEQRTLIVTHSNHALNDLFEKIMERSVDERYLLRLGHGEAGLEGDKDFSKFGRVNYMLSRRLQLLEDVAALARSLGLSEDAAYTAETAGHFFFYHVLSRWESFQAEVHKRVKQHSASSAAGPDAMQVDSSSSNDAALTYLRANFPFAKFFEHVHPLFTGDSVDADLQTARLCFADIEAIFKELEETRPFEVLRSGSDRGNYLLTKHAKVIAMTCTHAAIRRGAFIDLRFQYDNLIMEESAQILEIETFIPMLLQNVDSETGASRLKRVILLGDHHQLPPIIKNVAFQKYSHMEQSMFTRFVRLGVPTVQLNAQGRMRPSLATLWNWRYKNLGNLPAVLPASPEPRFALANKGLAHEFQFINVPDFNGRGESCPAAYFYQNLGEAEYVVALYMYMRLLGYPAKSISIITPYKGQKHLIRDVIGQRCAHNPLFGAPAKIATVDKFQGQQSDYILISLVRTKAVGHIRDIRRLVVAMSRARLGLYVFGRQSLFQNCLELSPSMNVLLTRPTKLQLVPNEWDVVDFSRKPDDKPSEVLAVDNVEQMGQIVHTKTQEIMQNQAAYQKQVAEFEAAEQEKKEKEERENERRARMAEQAAEERKLESSLRADSAPSADTSASAAPSKDAPSDTAVAMDEDAAPSRVDADAPVRGGGAESDDD